MAMIYSISWATETNRLVLFVNNLLWFNYLMSALMNYQISYVVSCFLLWRLRLWHKEILLHIHFNDLNDFCTVELFCNIQVWSFIWMRVPRRNPVLYWERLLIKVGIKPFQLFNRNLLNCLKQMKTSMLMANSPWFFKFKKQNSCVTTLSVVFPLMFDHLVWPS